MSADPQAVQTLFARAIEITDPAAREKFLSTECVDNPELYERVVKLLKALDGCKGFLEQPTKAPAETEMHAASAHQPGQLIAGRYKLLEAIGEGGMGTVWVAEQTQPIRRKVALKLVKPGMDSKQVLARFDAERQALALMDHPNIAKVFDGGMTDQGRPFFAMELVKGMPLTQYCDEMRLPVEERLKLFIPICQAVQHAHQKGIIHRDLKPSNVLICLYDGKPVPKVIDFGLAKAMHQPLTEQTVHTGFGLMIGTPLYMSPEQAEHNNLDVDTRTDVYSLGVMLYELLTGSTPLEKAHFKDAAFGEILRLIKDIEPPKPSTRVSTSAQLPNIAAQRNLDPDKLGRCIRGDLDWIVMKAIEKDRERRYESANGFARDIERFLNTEVVEACPPSAGYRLRRMARKHRAAITSAAAFAAVLILGTSLSLWQAVRATRAESLASRRLTDVQFEQRRTQQALKTSQESERRALESESIAVAARNAEAQARTAEAEQREQAEQQKQLAVQQRDEAQRLKAEATAKSGELEILTEQQRRVIYASEMSQVRIEAQRGNLARMREILLKQLPIDGRPDLRGFEWNYWYRYLNQAQVLHQCEMPDSGTNAPVAAVARGGDFVLAIRDNTTQFFSTKTGDLAGTVPGKRVGGRTYSSINGRVVTGNHSQRAYSSPILEPIVASHLQVWDISGKQWRFEYPSDSFSHVSYLNISPDGSIVGALGRDISHQPDRPVSRLLVWNIDTEELILNHLEFRELNGFEFSPDSQQLAAWVVHSSRRYSDELRDCAVVLDIVSGETRGVLEHNDDVEGAWWLPDGKRLLLPTLGFSGANRRQLLSWSAGDGVKRLLSQEAMPSYVRGVIDHDGRLVAVTGRLSNSIQVLDAENGELLRTLHHDGAMFDSLAFANDGKEIIATSTTGEVLKWQVNRNEDLFALRSKPLPNLASRGYEMSEDQSLLAVALADGGLLVRTREGTEFKLRDAIPNSTSGIVALRFCPKNRYLAYRTNIGVNGRAVGRLARTSTASGYGGLLELFDLEQQKRVWQRNCQLHIASLSPLAFGSFFGTGLEFSADGKKLVSFEAGKLITHDCESGIGKSYAGPDSLRRNPVTGDLFTFNLERQSKDGTMKWIRFDPIAGQQTEVTSTFISGGRPHFSPDSHYCVAPYGNGKLEVIDLKSDERMQIESGTGTEYSIVLYSPNSSRFAILNRKPREYSLERVAVWDIPGRRKLCEIPLGGDLPDDVKLNFDGTRLLTLHGKSDSYGGKIPRGRLWDVESGRELLDIPVTDVNYLTWDIAFDGSGYQLTTLVFNKASGTSRAGSTAVYDARPLDKAIDVELSADRLMMQLRERHALKSEWIAAVESLAGLDEGIRFATLNKIRNQDVDPNQIATKIGQMVGRRGRLQVEYERAVSWAEELQRLEPNTLRSRLMLGIAYFRVGRHEEAVELLSSVDPAETEKRTELDSLYYLIRHAALAQVYMQCGNMDKARAAAAISGTFSLGIANLDGARSRSVDLSWASGLWSGIYNFRPAPSAQTITIPSNDALDRFVTERMLSKNQHIDLEQPPFTSYRRMVRYDANADKKLDAKELVKALADMHRYGRAFSASDSYSIRNYPIASQLEFIDSAVQDAPNYLTARFVRAWMLATSPDDSIRNGERALADAQLICEETNYLDPFFLEALAAAFAEVNDFPSAVKWQSEAIKLADSERQTSPFLAERFQDAALHLSSFEAHQPLRSSAISYIGDFLNFMTAPDVRASDAVFPPLIAPDVVHRSRRIDGWGAAWSPDGKKIVRNLKPNDPEAPLEVLDLETGTTQQICEAAYNPVWPAIPADRIYFARGASEVSNSTIEEIWQCDINGENLTKVTDGGYPSLAQDGRLYVQQLGKPLVLKCFRIDSSLASVDIGLDFQLPDFSSYPLLSPSGKLVAFVDARTATLRIVDIESKKETKSIELGQLAKFGFSGGWSPNSRYLAFAGTSRAVPGLWLLDVATGVKRLLVDGFAINPRWSPNGRYIAADERDKPQIVILDLEQLQLEQGLYHRAK